MNPHALYWLWVGDSGTDEKIGSRAGGGRIKDVKTFAGSEEDGHD